MKKIEAIVQSGKLADVIDALKAKEVGGITVMKSHGIGASSMPMLSGSRGTEKYMAAFNAFNTVIVIVDDSKLSHVVSAIIDAAHTGTRGDGKIFVTNIEEAFDIATRESGANII